MQTHSIILGATAVSDSGYEERSGEVDGWVGKYVGRWKERDGRQERRM